MYWQDFIELSAIEVKVKKAIREKQRELDKSSQEFQKLQIYYYTMCVRGSVWNDYDDGKNNEHKAQIIREICPEYNLPTVIEDEGYTRHVRFSLPKEIEDALESNFKLKGWEFEGCWTFGKNRVMEFLKKYPPIHESENSWKVLDDAFEKHPKLGIVFF